MGSAQSSEADSGRACGMTWSEDANQTVCCTLFQGQPGEDGKGATPSKAGRRVSTSLGKWQSASALLYTDVETMPAGADSVQTCPLQNRKGLTSWRQGWIDTETTLDIFRE